jgi:hypothetical protein
MLVLVAVYGLVSFVEKEMFSPADAGFFWSITSCLRRKISFSFSRRVFLALLSSYFISLRAALSPLLWPSSSSFMWRALASSVL